MKTPFTSIKKLFGARMPFIIGGFVASVALLGFGSAAIVIGIQGRQDVRDTLAQENIVGTPDSTIPGQLVDTGSEAKAMADVMREHTLKSSGGLTYSELPKYLDASGKTTNDAKAAAIGPNGQAIENPARTLWVTETALTTALNTAYFAEQVGLFATVMGIALVLTGIGFSVLTVAALMFHRTTQETEEQAKAAAAGMTGFGTQARA
jgi:hypothetical protein